MIRHLIPSKLRPWLAVLSFLLAFFIILNIQERIQYHISIKARISKASYKEDKIREMLFLGDSLYRLDQHCKETGKNFVKEVTLRAILFDYELKDTNKQIYYSVGAEYVNEIEALPFYDKVYNIYKSTLEDVRYFPVPMDLAGRETTSFEDGFGDPRTYGGERKHEGTDIIPSINARGYFPVLSVCNGTVENIGWLPLGGWRIGICSESGGYYYYAHLDSYGPGLKEGDTVSAGQLLGFMGDTGYGKKEGTRGKFIVHLHFGIYVDVDDKQISINPYPILKYLMHSQIKYAF